MTTDEILKSSTPRPWIDIHSVASERGEPRAVADCELTKLAVNSYEANQLLIGKLVTALENSRSVLVIEGYLSGDNDKYAIMGEIDAALAEARKVLP